MIKSVCVDSWLAEPCNDACSRCLKLSCVLNQETVCVGAGHVTQASSDLKGPLCRILRGSIKEFRNGMECLCFYMFYLVYNYL